MTLVLLLSHDDYDCLHCLYQQGVLPALITPFLVDGGVDTAAVEQLVKVAL
jgi:hypothetical protein